MTRTPTEFSQPYSDLVSLIQEASCSSNAVDYFDLHGDDDAMRDAWNWLLKEQRNSFLALVKHIQAHGEEIIAAMDDCPDAPAEPPRTMLRAGQLADWVYTALTHYAMTAERATRDPKRALPDPTTLPQPGKWQRRGNTMVMRTKFD